ncbi:MAG: hypothetical protein J6K23_06445, partial [Bacilli bacterium]|nr:hypothetical protein [Bacilli bacterium]
INILENKTVGSAMLCINGYVAEYLNNDVSIVSDDCSEMENIIEYIVDKEGYQVSRTLIINYPKGNYEYYYKVSGKAKIGEDIIERDKEIKTTNNISILLEENQTVETWMIKNGKKISFRKYIEEEIDNIEIANVSIKETSASYPLLTSYGVEYSSKIELEYENQEGTSPYYSIDDGKTWIKYEGITTKKISSNKIKAKMVRDKSKREGSIVEKEISLASDALGIESYDDDTTTYFSTSNATNYIDIDKSVIGKTIKFNITLADARYPAYLKAIDSSDNVITTVRVTNDFEFTIPENTMKLNYSPYNAWGHMDKLCEIIIIDNPIISVQSPINTKISSSGITDAYNYISINYFENLEKKLYKINNGEWEIYTEKIKVNIDDEIIAKGVFANGKETKISEFKSEIINTVPKSVYDEDPSTYFSTSNATNYIDIDKSAIGKTIKFNITLADARYPAYLKAIDSSDNVITTVRVTNDFEFTIPENTIKLNYSPYNAWGHMDKLCEISIIE